MTSISAALASIKAAVDIVRLVTNTDVSLERAESKLKLAEMIEALADAKITLQREIDSLVDENRELKTKVSDLQQALTTDENLFFEDNSYWRTTDGVKAGPFCTLCWDRGSELVQKHRDPNELWFCPMHGKPTEPWVDFLPRRVMRDNRLFHLDGTQQI